MESFRMEFPSYVDLVKGATIPSLGKQKVKQKSKPVAQTKLFTTSPLTSTRSLRNNGATTTNYPGYLSPTIVPPIRQRNDVLHQGTLLDHNQLTRFFRVRKQYCNHLDAVLLVLQHVQQQYDHEKSYVHSLKQELDGQKLTISLLQNHNQELELINDTANRKIARLKSKLTEQKNYYLTKLKGKELNTSFLEENSHSPNHSLHSKSTPQPDIKQKIRNELRQIEEEERKWKATIEAQLRKFEEHDERTNKLQQQFDLYQRTDEWIRTKNSREEQSWKLRMEQLQQQEKGLLKMQQELDKQRASFEEDLWKHQQKLAMEHEQERVKFNEEKEKWRETQRKEDLQRRALIEDLKAQKAILQEEHERMKQQQQMLAQREEDKIFQEKFHSEKFQQQMEFLKLKEAKLKQEQEDFFKLQKQELLKLDSLRALQEELLKSEREAMMLQLMPQMKTHEASLRSQFELEVQAIKRSLQDQFAREKEQIVKQHHEDMELQRQIVHHHQEQADKERETYMQMKQQLEKWKIEFENNIKTQLEEEYKMKMARVQLVAKLESNSPKMPKNTITPSSNKPSLSESIQKLKKAIKEDQVEPKQPPVQPVKPEPTPTVEITSPTREKPKLPGSPLNPRRASPSEKSRSFHQPRKLQRTKTFQMLTQNASADSNYFPEYAKCPKCKGTFELRKNLLFSMCTCGYVHQPQEDDKHSPPNGQNKIKVIRTHSKTNLVRTSSFDTIPISANQIEKISPRIERSSSFHSDAPAPPPLPPLTDSNEKTFTPRVPLSARKDINGMNLIDEIKQLNVDVEKRLNAIAEAAAKKNERQTDTMSSLFSQIKRIVPNSARRMETMEATEKVRVEKYKILTVQARQQILEEKKKILDTQLQKQKQSLARTAGIEQLEEQRKKKDAELFAQYFSEQIYLEDEEDFEVVGVDDEDYESEEEDDEDEDLTSLVSSFMSPTESRPKQQPFNIPQLKIPIRDDVDVQMIEVDEEEEEEDEDLSSLISALVRN